METMYVDEEVKKGMVTKLGQLFGPLNDYQTTEVEKLLQQSANEIVRQTKKACCEAISYGSVHEKNPIDKRIALHAIQTCTVPYIK